MQRVGSVQARGLPCASPRCDSRGGWVAKSAHFHSFRSAPEFGSRFCAGVSRRPVRSTNRTASQVRATTEDAVLIGDIGGTNARLQVLDRKDFRTGEHDSLESVVTAFLAAHPSVKLRAVCFAVAGPVVDGRATLTNVENWAAVETSGMKQHLSSLSHDVPVAILNDFEALGYGIPCLADDEVLCLHNAPVQEQAPIVVIGPGTGLGACQLFWDPSRGSYRVFPGEGTHSDFAPRGDKQKRLLDFVEKELGYCEIEHVGCGAGLERIYKFLAAEAGVGGGDLDAKQISAKAGEGDAMAVEAMDMLLAIVGAEAGHMALRCLARGGVYIAGGIVPKNIARVEKDGGTLLEGFLNKRSRLSGLHASFRLSVVLNESVGLLGAESFARQLVGQ